MRHIIADAGDPVNLPARANSQGCWGPAPTGTFSSVEGPRFLLRLKRLRPMVVPLAFAAPGAAMLRLTPPFQFQAYLVTQLGAVGL